MSTWHTLILASKWSYWNKDEKALYVAMSFKGEAFTELSQLSEFISNDYDLLALALIQRSFSQKENTGNKMQF